MNSRHTAFNALRAAISGMLVLQLLCVWILAAVPAWHEQVHAGAHHEEGDHEEHGEHECAVTLFLSGACDCAAASGFSIGCVAFVSVQAIGREPVSRVFMFRSRGIFEHAPPQGV
ncbi:MAG: hypothetical protein V4710_01510 [Verrucomicrobiota bacterium]